VEKIRELANLLQVGIEGYEEQSNILQQERLKFMKLSLTDGFGDTEETAEDSWLIHLKNIEETLHIRQQAIQQAVKDCAAQIRQEEEAEKDALGEVKRAPVEETPKQAVVEEIEKGGVDEA